MYKQDHAGIPIKILQIGSGMLPAEFNELRGTNYARQIFVHRNSRFMIRNARTKKAELLTKSGFSLLMA